MQTGNISCRETEAEEVKTNCKELFNMETLSPLFFPLWWGRHEVAGEVIFTIDHSQFTTMNYIRHLNAFFSLVKTDNRLTAFHVSLYLALFHYWNFNRFNNPFSIYRENIMQLSKIGSKNTYHKCIKELHNAKYIYYHPAPSKFQVVRISVIRLDNDPEKKEPYKQLDLFYPPLKGEVLRSKTREGLSTNNDTSNVPKLGLISTDFDTDTVLKMGHLNKLNIYKQRETPTHKIFNKNDKIQKAINDFTSGDSKMGPSASGGSGQRPGEVPSQSEVEIFFQENSHPKEEAIKFFNHYKSLHWKLQGRTPILEWKPLVEKWMQNAKKWELSSAGGGGLSPSGGGDSPQASRERFDLQHLYNSFLQGHKIFKYISPEHFDQLKLELTEETLQNARSERINQVSGTNQHSLNDLWQAYLTGDPNNEVVIKDEPNLIALAKRIAVIKHFHNLKNQSQ